MAGLEAALRRDARPEPEPKRYIAFGNLQGKTGQMIADETAAMIEEMDGPSA